MIGAIYARASTLKQGETVEHQVQMIQEFCKRLEDDIFFDEKFIYRDDGDSAYKTTLIQRNSMQQLLKDVDAGLVEVVFFKGVSRFARDSGEAIQAVKKLTSKGVRVISMEENFDSDVSDPTFFQIYAVLAEAESRKTGVRVSLGNKQKARNGLYSGALPPMGYTKVKDIKDMELKEKIIAEGKHPQSLYPDPELSGVIKKVFDMYAEGIGRKRIASWMNNMGIKTPYGNHMTDVNLKRILMNEVYIGKIVYGKTRYKFIDDDGGTKKQQTIKVDKGEWAVCENAHPPIIDKDVFMKVQRNIKHREKSFNQGRAFNNAKHPLTGLLKCSLCGAPMICQKRTNKLPDGSKKTYRYYVCSTYHRKGRDVCPQANINADDLEDYIHKQLSEQIKKVKDDPYLLEGYTTNSSNNDMKHQLKMVEKELEKNTTKTLALLENKDLYDDQTFRELNLKLKEEIVKLRKQKEELQEDLQFQEEIISEEDLKGKLDEVLELNINDISETRRIFHDWINTVTVKDKKVYIDQKFRMLD